MSGWQHSYEKRFNVSIGHVSHYTDDANEVLALIAEGKVGHVDIGYADINYHDHAIEYIRRTARSLTADEFVAEFAPSQQG